MDRKLNYLSLFLLAVLFVTAANTQQQWHMLLGLMLGTAFGFLAFLLRRLTLDGMFASIVLAIFILGLGGWPTTAVVLLFFVSSAVLSSNWRLEARDLPIEVRRDGLQVWANGFWLMLGLSLFVIFKNPLFLVSALAAVATANSDTWATELGSKSAHSTYLISNFEKVTPGTDGGVSFRGTIAALSGSAVIAAFASYVFSLQFAIFICIFTAGFLGCLLDSYFGAVLQRNNTSVHLPGFALSVKIDNNIVNLVSTGIGAILAIILKLILA